MEEDVYNPIKKMGAGVNIVLSDCCNNTVAGANVNIDNVMVTTHKHNHSRQTDAAKKNGHELFMPDEHLSILATAASPGELSCGKDKVGGFFTTFFLDDLDDLIDADTDDDDNDATWESIFKYAKDNAAYQARSAPCPTTKHNEQGRCVQTVKIKIETGN